MCIEYSAYVYSNQFRTCTTYVLTDLNDYKILIYFWLYLNRNKYLRKWNSIATCS